MNRAPLLGLLALIPCIALVPRLPAAAKKPGKTHLGVPSDRICTLYTTSIHNETGSFHFDLAGAEVTVPDGMSFVVTDLTVAPDTLSFAATDKYFVDVAFDFQGNRHYLVRSLGPDTVHVSFAGGIVCPAGVTPSATSLPASTNPVYVYVHGYFVKGDGLPPNASPF